MILSPYSASQVFVLGKGEQIDQLRAHVKETLWRMRGGTMSTMVWYTQGKIKEECLIVFLRR